MKTMLPEDFPFFLELFNNKDNGYLILHAFFITAQ